MKKLLLFTILLSVSLQFFRQESDVPTGWKFGGALPAISYDSDVGFRYGGLGYVYDWGDGSYYPDYKKSIYLEWSRTTKGSGNNIIQYDDKAFFGSKIRFTSELGYYIEQALDFYGFNGYQSVFNPAFSTTGSSEYRSRMFYRIDRRMFRGVFDFQFPLNGNKLRLYSGMSLFYMKIGSVDIDKINKGKDPADMLPSVDSVPGLYENYVNWGLINSSEANGGFVTQLKGGVIYDTRNNEALPTKGLWDELVVIGAPGTGGTSPYLQLVATHRQYFNIIENHLSFAYRAVVQAKLAGNIPFYMLPFYYSTKEIKDGIGGSKTVRGMLRDRVVADAVVFGNAELRYRVVNFDIKTAHFYVALSAFADAARVITPYEVDFSKVPAGQLNTFFNNNPDDLYKIHLTYGGGIRIAYNENTIVAVDYGLANDDQDGSSGMYIGLGWLF